MKVENDTLIMYGEIEFYNKKKNLGMIHGKGDVLFFFHASNLRDKDTKIGDKVTFQARKSNITTENGRLFAKNIRRIENV